jgi:biopolymer transport protein ExbD
MRFRLVVTADGAVRLNGTQVAVEELASAIRAKVERSRELANEGVHFCAESGAPRNAVWRVLNIVMSPGLPKVWLITQPEATPVRRGGS